MAAPILHLGATMQCSHAGTATPTAPYPRVTVSDQAVVTISTQYVIAGCALTGTPNPPCATAQWSTGATRVKSMGQPVLLKDSQSLCTPTGTALTVMMTQIRVKAT
jgi:hypothetical protein